MEETTMTLANLITALTSVVTSIFSQVGTVFDTALDNPMLQLMLGIFFAGAIVGMCRRIFNLV